MPTPTARHAQRPARNVAPPQRRFGSRIGPRARAERDRLVLAIAGNPDYLGWLYDHNADVLNAEATRCDERGLPALAVILRERAEKHRRQEVSPW